MSLLRYTLREALINIRRSATMGWVAILTMSFTLLFFGIFLLISININEALRSLKGRATIAAYVKDGVSEEKIKALHGVLRRLEGVEKVEYVSKEEALRLFRKDLGPQSFILDALETNPLPATFEIKADGSLSGKEVVHLAHKIKGLVGIEGVDYGERLIEVLSNISFLAKTTMLGVGTAFGLATLLIIFNTIKLTLFSRHREIEIMRLVGATDSFISLPYILEGVLQGLLAGMISISMLWILHKVILYRINRIGFIPFGFNFLSTENAILIVLIGLGLGLLGALVSVRHFLVRRRIQDEEA
jgi:cell division transport system permease protein